MKSVETEQSDRHGRQVRRTKDPKSSCLSSCLMPGNAFVPHAVDLGLNQSSPDTRIRLANRMRLSATVYAVEWFVLSRVCFVEWFLLSLTRMHPTTKPSGGEAERLVIVQVGMTGFEPATSWSQTRRSSQAELHPVARSQSRDESTTRQ